LVLVSFDRTSHLSTAWQEADERTVSPRDRGADVLERGRGCDDANVVTVRVLVVDDDPDMRLLLGVMLQLDGVEVVAEAANGVEAIDAAREHQPDVVVLDEAMPVMSGSEAVPGLREAAPRMRIVMFTAHGETDRRQQLEAIADAVVVKGSSLNALIDQVMATA
jgi:DNA-binding NarL/FixJ family response regulator